MHVETINPHGFCAGVSRALEIVRKTLAARKDRNVFCLHDIVHNETVMAGLAEAGLRVADNLDPIPSGSILLASAHGVSPAIVEEAKKKGIEVVDATCPVVAAAHAKIRENFSNGIRTAIIGDRDHAEVLGYLGEPGACLPEELRPGEKAGRVVQTTFTGDGATGICTASADRRSAVRAFVAGKIAQGASPDGIGVVVAGSGNSANTRRLAESARAVGGKAWIVPDAQAASNLDLAGMESVGATAGASTPEDVFLQVVAALESRMD